MGIYFDYAATTPVDPRVAEAMLPYLTERFGNPSSIHRYGRDTRDAVESSRALVAGLLHAAPEEIVFTSGGTESDNMAIYGVCQALRDQGNHIITTGIEHHAVLHACEHMASHGFEMTAVPAGTDGIVDPDDIRKAVRKNTLLISVMHANNEIGTIQPVAEIGKIARESGVRFHTDAVQTFGHVSVDVDALSVDLLSLSAHKLYGPKGAGALYLRRKTPFIPLIHGGNQESGRRSSTLNVTGIVGLGEAARLASEEMDRENARILDLRNMLLDRLLASVDGIRLNGDRHRRLANNIHVSIDYIEGEALLMALDEEGIAASSGSACSSGSDAPSHVLTALGVSSERARGSLRVTLGRYTTREEIDRASQVIPDVVKKLQSLSPYGR